MTRYALSRIAFLLVLALLAMTQGCELWRRVFPREQYKPVLTQPTPTPAPPPPAPVAAAPDEAPKTSVTQAMAPGEATRPGNPASWGDAGKLGVGREFDAVYFNGQETDLDTVAKGRLEGYAKWLNEHPHVWVTLAGHADLHGNQAYAYNLGMARALAAADYLIGRGVERGRVYTISYGKDHPVVDAADPQSDALNNRVDVLGFVPPPGQSAPASAGPDQNPPESEAPPVQPSGKELTK